MTRSWAGVLVAAVLAVAACGGDDSSESGSSTSDDTAGSPDATASFEALSYNVAGLPEGISGSSPEANAPLISPLLDDFDLVLLQEDFDFYTDALRADITHEHVTEPHPGPEVENPIDRADALVGDGLNRLSRFPLGELTRVPWSDCGAASADCLALKGFSHSTVALDEGVVIDVYNLHNEAGGEDEQLRQDDLDALAAFMAERSEGAAVIVGGDWNLHTDEEPDATQYAGFLTETGLTDVCAVAACGADADQIDKFAFRGSEDLVIEPTSHRFARDVFVDADGEPLSDHDPLTVTFAWTAL